MNNQRYWFLVCFNSCIKGGTMTTYVLKDLFYWALAQLLLNLPSLYVLHKWWFHRSYFYQKATPIFMWRLFRKIKFDKICFTFAFENIFWCSTYAIFRPFCNFVLQTITNTLDWNQDVRIQWSVLSLLCWNKWYRVANWKY